MNSCFSMYIGREICLVVYINTHMYTYMLVDISVHLIVYTSTFSFIQRRSPGAVAPP